MISSTGLLPLEKQEEKLTLNFVNNGYNVAWLGQKPPAFTTTEYALAPFLPSGEETLLGTNQTWTGNTVLYTTDLTCQPASVSQASTSYKLTFDDGHGCIARNQILAANDGVGAENISAYYIGYYGDGSGETNVSLSGCGSAALHEFLAVWKRIEDTPNFQNSSAFAALFCWSKYFQQEVEATVSLPGYSVEKVRPISERKELSEQVFDYTRFEKLIVTEVLPLKPQNSTSPQADFVNRFDISDETALDTTLLLRQFGVDGHSKLVPFILGMSGLPPEALLQSSNLQNAVQSAHRMLFALAAQTVMSPPVDTGRNISGVMEASLGAVVMVEVFTFLVIGSLCLMIALAVYLLYTYKDRALNLRSRPDSIASIMALIHRQDHLISIFSRFDRSKIEIIETRLKDRWFKLHFKGQECQLMTTSGGDVADEDLFAAENHVSKVQPWPWALRLLAGVSFILILISGIASVLILQKLIQRENGKLVSKPRNCSELK